MKYNHTVKYKGVFYSAGTEVPVEEVKVEQSETDEKEEKTETPVTEEKGKDSKKK